MRVSEVPLRSLAHARVAVVVLIALAALWAGMPSPAAAAPPAQNPVGIDQPSPFLQLFPELRQLPAPRWLQEGLRTTYYVQGATFEQGPDAINATESAIVHDDVVALDARNAAISTSLYLLADAGVSPAGVFGSTALPSVGEYWIHPSVLKHAERVATDDLAVLHMPATVAGKQYQAVRFQYTDGHSVTVWMFEEATGLLVSYRHTVGEMGDPDHSSHEVYLVSQRMLNLPWQGKRVPAWVKPGLALDYDGTRSMAVAGNPSAKFRQSAAATVRAVQPRWSSYDVSSSLNGYPQGTARRVTGVRQLTGALWLPAEALATRVRSGLLDKDPTTGVETYYERAGGNVVITEKGPLHVSEAVYDGRTGKLISTRVATQTGLATQTVDLQLVE